MKYLTITAFFVSLLSSHADQFYLIDASGSKQGPYNVTQGEKIIIAGKAFTVSLPDTARQQTLSKMKQRVIDEIEFREATLPDILDFLQHQSMGDYSMPEYQRWLSIGLSLPASTNLSPKVIDDPFGAGPYPFKGYEITFSARYMSIYDVVSSICQLAGLEWHVDDNGVLIIKKKESTHEGKSK